MALDADDPTAVEAAFAVAGPVDIVYYLVHGIASRAFVTATTPPPPLSRRRPPTQGCGGSCTWAGSSPMPTPSPSIWPAGPRWPAPCPSTAALNWCGWGAAVIIGAGSTSFEMVRYVGDRFWLIPLPPWAEHDIDPISNRDVLYYLLGGRSGYRAGRCLRHRRTEHHHLPRAAAHSYVDAAGSVRAGLPVDDVVPRSVVARVAGTVVPVPTGLATDLIESLDHSMTASDTVLRDYVPDPPGGLTDIDDAIAAAVSSPPPRPVDQLADPHHLADSDPVWAGGDTLRLQRLAAAVDAVGGPARTQDARRGAAPARRCGAHRARLPARQGAHVMTVLSEIRAAATKAAVPHQECRRWCAAARSSCASCWLSARCCWGIR